jgi:putative hydrolase of the HAD superfamily
MTRYDQSFFLKKKMLNNQNSGLIKRLPKLIIFDLDDTLFPERDFVRGGYRAASMLVWEDFGIEIENDLNKKFNQGLRGDLFTSVLLERNVEFDREYVPNRIVPAYRSHKPNIQTFLDVIPFLTALRDVGHKLALISDGWFSVQKNKFTALKLECFFDEVLFTDEFGRENWKPSLQPFLRVCEKTCIDPTRAMYIGDNPFKDFIAPNKLGMESVRIRRSGLEHTPYESVKKNACAKQEISSFTDFHHLVSF